MAEKKESVEVTVRTTRRVTRKKYSAEEKARIVLEGLRGETSTAALCRREGIPSNLYSRRTPRSPPSGILPGERWDRVREAASPGPTHPAGVRATPSGCASRGETAGTVYRWSKECIVSAGVGQIGALSQDTLLRPRRSGGRRQATG